MTTPKDHAPIETGFDVVRDMSRSLVNQERRPDVKRARDLLGPGFGPHAIQLLDWNSATARFNGLWTSTDALNGPTETGKYLGLSIATADGHIAQLAIDHQHEHDQPNTIYVRRIHTHESQAVAYTPWQPLGGGTGGGLTSAEVQALIAASLDPVNTSLADKVDIQQMEEAFAQRSDLTVNVRSDFGAVGNGIADDTAAIQAAINYVTAEGGGRVLLPRGVYRTTATLTLNGNFVSFIGHGLASIISYGGTDFAVRYGTSTSGQAVIGSEWGNMRIRGTSVGAGGMQWVGAQRSAISGVWRIENFTQTGAVGLEFLTQVNNLASPVNTTNNVIYRGDITNCYHGYRSTRGVGVTSSYGPSHNVFVGVRVSSFTGVGWDNDWGENNSHFGCDISTTVDGAIGTRVNDDVCSFYSHRSDCSSGSGNTNIGWVITPSANAHIIIMPTGDGPSIWMRFGEAPFGEVRSRIQVGTNPPYGEVVRQSVNYKIGHKWVNQAAVGQDFYTARTWHNASASTIGAGELGYFDSTCAEGEVKRTDSVARPNPMVAVQTITGGTPGGFAEAGSVLNVQCDAGAVAVGDQLVVSTTANGRAMTDNAETRPRMIVGVARSAKAAGANGPVKAYIA